MFSHLAALAGWWIVMLAYSISSSSGFFVSVSLSSRTEVFSTSLDSEDFPADVCNRIILTLTLTSFVILLQCNNIQLCTFAMFESVQSKKCWVKYKGFWGCIWERCKVQGSESKSPVMCLFHSWTQQLISPEEQPRHLFQITSKSWVKSQVLKELKLMRWLSD